MRPGVKDIVLSVIAIVYVLVVALWFEFAEKNFEKYAGFCMPVGLIIVMGLSIAYDHYLSRKDVDHDDFE
jgi:hypothetical protein